MDIQASTLEQIIKIYLLISQANICCVYSKEPSHKEIFLCNTTHAKMTVKKIFTKFYLEI